MNLTERRLKSLIGENPLDTERLWHLIWEIDRVEEMHMTHLGLVDLLAWDIKIEEGEHAALADARRQRPQGAGLRLDRDLGDDGRVRALHQALHRRRLQGLQAARLGRRQGGREALRATCANGSVPTPT